MEHLYYCRIQAKLRDNQVELGGCALAIWDKFAHNLGINKAAPQEKWRRERHCGNPRCERRREKNPKQKKSVKICMQCKSLFYCSKACQWRYVVFLLADLDEILIKIASVAIGKNTNSAVTFLQILPLLSLELKKKRSRK